MKEPLERNEEDEVYQFEDMEVDIIPPEMQDKPTFPSATQDTSKELQIRNHLDQLKQTYILGQKPPRTRLSPTSKTPRAAMKKPFHTRNYYSTVAMNSQKEKQNIEMLLQERRTKQLSEKCYLLQSLKAPLECIIEVEKVGIFNLQPIYRLFSVKESRFLLACQKEGVLTNSHVFSTNPRKVSSQQVFYFGKLKPLDLRSNEWMLYDQGFDPSKVREIQDCRAQLMYGVFDQGYCGLSETNSLKILTPSNLMSIDSYKELLAESNVLTKYEKSHPSKIETYSYQRSNISNNFKHKLFDIPIQGSFVVSPEGSHTPLIYFGKRDQNKYLLEIHPPFSILQAFALSVLHLKFNS